MFVRHVRRVLTGNATLNYFWPLLGLPGIPAVKLIVGTSIIEVGVVCQLCHRRVSSAQYRPKGSLGDRGKLFGETSCDSSPYLNGPLCLGMGLGFPQRGVFC